MIITLRKSYFFGLRRIFVNTWQSIITALVSLKYTNLKDRKTWYLIGSEGKSICLFVVLMPAFPVEPPNYALARWDVLTSRSFFSVQVDDEDDLDAKDDPTDDDDEDEDEDEA